MMNTLEDDKPISTNTIANNNEEEKTNPYYEAGMVPTSAMIGNPKGVPIQQTIYRDTPAPFDCAHCASPPALAIVRVRHPCPLLVCMLPTLLGFCFLCPSVDCLWHKYHYCPSCKEKVVDFEKDSCAVMDPSHRL